MKYAIFLFFSICILACSEQDQNQRSSAAILEKAIQYHDPANAWESFHANLHLYQIRADNSKRRDYVQINNKESKVLHQRHLGDTLIFRSFSEKECENSLRIRNTDIKDTFLLQKYGLTCARAEMYRNYYTYLYGLPMKLKDPGTLLDSLVTPEKFVGKECWSMRVTYAEGVGDDIWYFYFDLQDYRLIGYRFYHDETKKDGEFIICNDEIEIAGIKMPKNRSWYKHADNSYLATDIIESATPL